MRMNTTVLTDGIYRGPKNAVAKAHNEKIDNLFSNTPGYYPYKEKIGKHFTRPKIVHAERPAYPLWARQTWASAVIFLAVLIDKDGSIKDVKVLISTDQRFDNSAIDAVKKWKFTGGLTDGVPDMFAIVLPITYVFARLPGN